jgi:hypothetical protein
MQAILKQRLNTDMDYAKSIVTIVWQYIYTP